MNFRKAWRTNGFVGLLGTIAVFLIGGGGAIVTIALVANGTSPALVIVTVVAVLVALAALIVMTGLTVVSPNEAKVLQFFGRYIGSISDAGFYLVTPMTDRRTISLRVRNFETQKLKVNDADGNPVEIAAVVVYQVVDTFKAAFAVDDYEEYVAIQSEAAVRHLATSYPYDSHREGVISLRDGATIAEELTVELRERTERAGIEIIEARITHLAYAPEIAQASPKRVFHVCFADETLDRVEDRHVVDGLGLYRQGSDSRGQRLEDLLVSREAPRDRHLTSQVEVPVKAAVRVPQ